MSVIRVPWEQARTEPFSSSPLGQLIEGVRSAACQLYRNYPDFALGDPLGVGALSRSVWDAVCPLPSEQPPERPPLNPVPQGGRCFCIPYELVIARRVGGTPQGNIVTTVNGPVVVRGWVAGLNPGRYDFRIEHRSFPACDSWTFQNVFANIALSNISPSDTWAEVLSITRVGGGEDTCGYQPPIYQPQAPPPAPLLDFDVPVTVSPGVNILVPVVFVQPSLNVDVNLNPSINLNPSFNIDLAPDININISLGFGGPKISLQPKPAPPGAPTIPPSPSPDPRSPKPLPPIRISPDDQDCCDELLELVRRLQEQVKELSECACPPPPNSRSLVAQANSGDVQLPDGTRQVEVQVTTLPPRARSWDGGDGPSPVTAGWGWFKFQDGYLGERSPVDATRKIFPVPRGAASFCWTLYTGGVANVFVRRRI